VRILFPPRLGRAKKLIRAMQNPVTYMCGQSVDGGLSLSHCVCGQGVSCRNTLRAGQFSLHSRQSHTFMVLSSVVIQSSSPYLGSRGVARLGRVRAETVIPHAHRSESIDYSRRDILGCGAWAVSWIGSAAGAPVGAAPAADSLTLEQVTPALAPPPQLTPR